MKQQQKTERDNSRKPKSMLNKINLDIIFVVVASALTHMQQTHTNTHIRILIVAQESTWYVCVSHASCNAHYYVCGSKLFFYGRANIS